MVVFKKYFPLFWTFVYLLTGFWKIAIVAQYYFSNFWNLNSHRKNHREENPSGAKSGSLQKSFQPFPNLNAPGLVCSGCHNKRPQTGGASNNKNLFSHSCENSKFKVKASRGGVWWEFSLWVVDGCLLCVLTWAFLALLRAERASELLCLLLRTLVLVDRGSPLRPHLTSITPVKVSFPNIVTLDVGSSTYESVGETHSIHNISQSWHLN